MDINKQSKAWFQFHNSAQPRKTLMLDIRELDLVKVYFSKIKCIGLLTISYITNSMGTSSM